MTKRDENRLSMYFTVLQVVNFHYEVWKDSVAFANFIKAFKNCVSKIDKTRQIQLRSITGVTQIKAGAKLKAVEQEIGVILVAYQDAK